MRAGRLIHRIKIMQADTGKDAAGAPVDTVSQLAEIWARVDYISGRERWANEHVTNNYRTSVLIRPNSAIKENMQVHHGDRVLDIKSIIPEANGTKADMVLLCVDHGN